MGNQSGSVQGKQDVRWEPLYDTVTLANAAYTKSTQRFFSTAISGSKTLQKTNMVNAGALPSPQGFKCFGIRMEAFLSQAAGTISDIAALQTLAMDSYIRFFVGSKDYFTAPLAAVCGGIDLSISGSASTHTTTPDPMAYTYLGRPNHYGFRFPKNQYVQIGSAENFGVEWVINTTLTTNSSIDFKCFLDGLRGVDVR